MQSQGWMDALSGAAVRLVDVPLAKLIAEDPGRATAFALRVGPLYFSCARQRIDRPAWQALQGIASSAGLRPAIQALFDGEPVNRSEARPALHTALRSELSRSPAAVAARDAAKAARAQMERVAAQLLASGVRDVINVGIGGSDLGPRLAIDALRHVGDSPLRVHFLSAPDGHVLDALLRRLDPQHTAVLLVSKSFGTEETLLNGAVLREWQGGASRLYAATANGAAAAAWGVPNEQILPLWDWVGGRYSLWSAAGFAVRLGLGCAAFDGLLAGAAAMDAHVLGTPSDANLAIWHALIEVWNRNALGYDSRTVLSYDARLQLLPAYLQQLVMESLGKSAQADGRAIVSWGTSPVLWGGTGTDCQHSFFQALHQGTDTVPVEFIGVLRPDHAHARHHQVLLSHLLAQSEALANGCADSNLHKHYPGSRPSSIILLDELSPRALGMLIALYEHSVYAQSVIWGINAFDQFGVELGKRIAKALTSALSDSNQPIGDPVTATLLGEYRQRSA